MGKELTVEQMAKDCLSDLYTYAQMMLPDRYFGDVHAEFFRFFQKSLENAVETGDGDNAGALIPRDHQKSFCIAVATSWAITKFPEWTVVYVSSNPTLSERQLTVIKNILKSEEHRELYPEMLNYELNPRSKEIEHKTTGVWTKTEIVVDHPKRPKTEKDPTVSATSAKSTNTGSHFKLCVFDDLVTNENYRSAADRETIREVYQSFASIATTGSLMWLVGTRYGDNDLYADLKEKTYEVYDDKTGEELETKPLWNWFERVVEDSKSMDGTGNFLWARTRMENGNWYGFNATELSKKRSSAFNLDLYYCQYYNTPNASGQDRVGKNNFMYANASMLEQRQGDWYYADKKLTLGCGMDLAFTEGSGHRKTKRDATAISVIAWDEEGYLYVLQQERFQTDKVEIYYDKLFELYDYWGFREATVESNSGGTVIIKYIQDTLRQAGRPLVVKGISRNQVGGSKEERFTMTVEPLYRNNSVYHFKGGYCRMLEEEIRLARPPHDDLKDSLQIAVEQSKRAAKGYSYKVKKVKSGNVLNARGRFQSRTRRRA